MILFFDLETRRGGEIKNGIDAHLETAEIAWTGWAVDDLPVQAKKGLPDEFVSALLSCDAVVAHNAPFDLRALQLAGKFTDAPQFACTLSMASAMKIPVSLAKCAAYLGLEKKLDVVFDEQDLFQPSDQEWMDYVSQDVELCRQIYKRLRPALPDSELHIIDAHCRVNVAGIPIDRQTLAEAARSETEKFHRLDNQLREITGGIGLNKSEKLKNWFNYETDRGDCGYEELKGASQDDVSCFIDNPAWAGAVPDAAKTIVKAAGNEAAKLNNMIASVGKDGRLRDTMRYNKTISGRWAGQGGAPLQNPKRAGYARANVRAPRGKFLYIADFAQVEVRAGLWVAGMESDLENLHKTDWYMSVAREVFGDDAGDDERFWAKQGVLGAMYNAGAKAMARSMKVDTGTAHGAYVKIKHRFDPIVRMSARVWAAFKEVAQGKDAASVSVGIGKDHSVVIRNHGKKLSMQLPTGRRVYYINHRMDDGAVKFGVGGAVGGAIHHQGTIYAHLVSGSCRDMLAFALASFTARCGWDVKRARVIHHIHDELIFECEDDGDDLGAAINARMVDIGQRVLPNIILDAEGKFSQCWEKP